MLRYGVCTTLYMRIYKNHKGNKMLITNGWTDREDFANLKMTTTMVGWLF